MSFLLLALFVFDTFLGFVNLRTSMEANRLLLDNMTPPPVVQAAKVPEVMLPSSVSLGIGWVGGWVGGLGLCAYVVDSLLAVLYCVYFLHTLLESLGMCWGRGGWGCMWACYALRFAHLLGPMGNR